MASLLLSLLSFFLIARQTSAVAEFWNIDCGASASHIENTMTWVGDDEYVRTGESHAVLNLPNNMPERIKTLRSFPTGAKNCYSIPTGEKRKVHVKVDFLYGNYDGLKKPPSFNLVFDAHSICSVTTNMDTSYYSYCSWTYETRSSNISICFGRDAEDQVPFVNAVQVVALDEGIYPEFNSSTVLFERWRVAFGPDAAVRYPYDAYDRYWFPSTPLREGYNYTMLSSNTTGIINTSSCVDNPPKKLFGMAATSIGETMSNLTIRTLSLPSSFVPVYLNMYFSEMSNLAGTRHKRSFHIYVDDILITPTKPVEPSFSDALEVSGVVPASASTRITLVPTANSTLPPIISGLELLKMDQIESNGTDSQDVQGLLTLQNKFEGLMNWSGDPCRPKEYNWEWVNCNDIEPPRVIAL